MKKTGSPTGRLFRKSGRDLGEIPMREEASWWLKLYERYELYEKTAELFPRLAKEVLMRVERLMDEGP